MSEHNAARIHIRGIVQGVGFRPFVYGLARRLSINGWVRNTSAGVDIVAEGTPADLAAFIRALQGEHPPLAQIDSLELSEQPGNGFNEFQIVPSEPVPGAFQPISPDVSICADCLRELYDPADRRYRYPFINCTNCGPRFTIIQDIPYDRPSTTMAPFPLCSACAAEYHDPLDRRFHAQPVACPECGPHVWLEASGEKVESPRVTLRGAAIHEARQRLMAGQVVAVKGLGGFHLACDATNRRAVDALRRRKLRVGKPFAVMMADLVTVERHCHLTDSERALISSRQRPIVILQRRANSPIESAVAPGQTTLGVMLPYTPLHHLLLEPSDSFSEALVMTSGNLSEEPIVTTNKSARQNLSTLADALLMHNRPIHTRCDDAVMHTFENEPYPLRRSRGYAPFPVKLPWLTPSILATGAEMKNVFCLTKDRYAFMSHHIGELENLETLSAFEEGIDHFQRLFRVTPEIIAYDLHPDYLATRYARERAAAEGIPTVGVQHHHAHICAAMGEHGFTGEQPVIGVAFDGTGYGSDGAIWGGEFLIADYDSFQRPYHLDYAPLPGGDAAIRQPWRMALSWLHQCGIDWQADLPPVRWAEQLGSDRAVILKRQLAAGINTPPTSSMGRLFDAAASLIGIRQEINYEAQAAIELEASAAVDEDGRYPVTVGPTTVDPTPLLAGLVTDLQAGVQRSRLAARFHNSIA
ncbi:MAG: carbamoyltransferase HypF, partial [Candidatus Promineifilaceae bacterium]|nr:carbamoyltransferase HypF [Candidatus Promineifilaceae bacterium]